MSEAETIGVDLGGTKIQVGVLAGVETLWESRETSRGQDQDELVELLVREVNAARDARPDAVAVGLGIPATINQERGVAIATWARRLATDPRSVGPADVERLVAAGFDRGEILSLTLFVALRIAFATVNGALGAVPEEEYVDLVPAAVREAWVARFRS